MWPFRPVHLKANIFLIASLMNFNDTASDALQQWKFSRYNSISRSLERFKVGLPIHSQNAVRGLEPKSRRARNEQFHPLVGIYVDAAAGSSGGLRLGVSQDVLRFIGGWSGELQFSSRCYSYVLGVGMVKYSLLNDMLCLFDYL
ncbi:Hypothetical_protein [Hexamita inflata]|uniref:Hypothetical_protein n=1 Tax=Hexamita inflata TaxID=28002 RepID=A0AA86Q8Q8_9EUKA|nr:Hypothetical protein HINF_LOCUS37331 [Hexamita inflata]CAI9954331.1 Hypothetical protein HINF_LOCUS41976 [Hexamita inflata]